MALTAPTALNYFAMNKSALATRRIVALVLAVLLAVVVTGWPGDHPRAAHPTPINGDQVYGVLATGFRFFTFAGYAHIAPLGEEVRDRTGTIPRAAPVALGLTLVLYAALAVAALGSLLVLILGVSQTTFQTRPALRT